MNLANKTFCDWDLVRFVNEEQLLLDGVPQTLSVTCLNKYELMIFLGKSDDDKLFEVRVYKAEPSQGYVIHDCDKLASYGENEEFATFGFNNYYDAIDFLEAIPYRHPEYNVRPFKMLNTEKDEVT